MTFEKGAKQFVRKLVVVSTNDMEQMDTHKKKRMNLELTDLIQLTKIKTKQIIDQKAKKKTIQFPWNNRRENQSDLGFCN